MTGLEQLPAGKTGASLIKDMSRVMGIAAKKLAGKADNDLISGLVKELTERLDFIGICS